MYMKNIVLKVVISLYSYKLELGIDIVFVNSDC